MNSANRQFERVIIGAAVSYIIISIILGDALAAGTLILVSVICTLGVSLVMWLPFWWGTGWIVLAIVDLIRAGITQSSTVQLHTTQPAVRDTIALTGYIYRSRLAGASDSQIMTRLREQGWTDVEITQALQQPSTEQGDR